MTTKSKNYLVFARDANDITIASIKAIDAFSSTLGLADARDYISRRVAEGVYAEHGDVVIWVSQTSSIEGTRNVTRRAKVVQVDSCCGEHFVRVVFERSASDLLELSDDEGFETRQAAIGRAKELAKEYGVHWEGNW